MSSEITKNEDMQDETKVRNEAQQTKSSASSGGSPNEDPSKSSHRYECRNCGYVYDPIDGVKKFSIPGGTAFSDLDQLEFRCPVCRQGVNAFKDIGPRSAPSGFEENLNYGFGINNLTPGQKNVLIFGGLAFAFACFLSLYSLH